MKLYLIVAVLGAAAPSALAQPHPGGAGAKATDASARVPQAAYRSAFENYVPYREPTIVPWRELNDDVARAGGHVGLFRAGEFSPPRPGAAKPPGDAPPSGAADAGKQPPVRTTPPAPAGVPSNAVIEGKPAAGGHHAH